MEFLPGSKLKVSRDFLDNIGMTDSLIPFDVHVLAEIDQLGELWPGDFAGSVINFPKNRRVLGTLRYGESSFCDIFEISKVRQVFGDDLNRILDELNEVLAA